MKNVVSFAHAQVDFALIQIDNELTNEVVHISVSSMTKLTLERFRFPVKNRRLTL